MQITLPREMRHTYCDRSKLGLGEFELRLQAMWQGQALVSFTGTGAELELLGEPKYVEEFRL